MAQSVSGGHVSLLMILKLLMVLKLVLLIISYCIIYVCPFYRYMSHDRYGLWRLGISHVLNAAHGKMCCKGSDDFYGTTVQYYGVAANDLPTFDISPFFYPSAHYIHQALSTPGGTHSFCCATLYYFSLVNSAGIQYKTVCEYIILSSDLYGLLNIRNFIFT